MSTVSYNGTIVKIEPKKSPGGFNKQIVHLSMPNEQLIFIEFRSQSVQKALKKYKEDSKVSIETRAEGKIANVTGTLYNNIIATRISEY